MVDQVVNQAASQKAAVAGNQALSQAELDKLYHLDDEAKTKISPEQLVTKAAQGKNIAQASLDVLRNFLTKASQVGLSLNSQNVAQNVKDKFSRDVEALYAKENFRQDQVQLSSKQALKEQQSLFLANEQDVRQAPNTKAELASLCSQYMVSNDPKIKQQIEKIAQRSGLTPDEVSKLEQSVRSLTKNEVMSQVKEGLKMHLLSPRSGLENISHMHAVSTFLQDALGNKKLFFGESHEAGQKIVDGLASEASDELKPYLLEQLENLFIRKTLTQDNDFTEVRKLLDTCAKSMVDVDYYIEKVWPERKEDLGLYTMDLPQSAVGANVDTSTDDQKNQARNRFEASNQDEREIHFGRLRALYMQKALHGGLKGLITEFKIVGSRRQGFKLGILTKELDAQLQHEGKLAAKIKLVDILKEALMERASLYELAGPAFKLNERKVKTTLASARRLGLPISEQEFINMRNAADRRMMELAQREYQVVDSRLSHTPDPRAEKKRALLVKLMDRISQEAKIEKSPNFSISNMQNCA